MLLSRTQRISLDLCTLRRVQTYTPFRVPIPERRVERFQCFRPKPTLYSDSPYPRPCSTHFLMPTCILGGLFEPSSILDPYGLAVSAGYRFGSVKRPEYTRGYQEMCEMCGVGSRVRESDYEVGFGLTLRKGELCSYDPETLGPFDSPIQQLIPERSADLD